MQWRAWVKSEEAPATIVKRDGTFGVGTDGKHGPYSFFFESIGPNLNLHALQEGVKRIKCIGSISFLVGYESVARSFPLCCGVECTPHCCCAFVSGRDIAVESKQILAAIRQKRATGLGMTTAASLPAKRRATNFSNSGKKSQKSRRVKAEEPKQKSQSRKSQSRRVKGRRVKAEESKQKSQSRRVKAEYQSRRVKAEESKAEESKQKSQSRRVKAEESKQKSQSRRVKAEESKQKSQSRRVKAEES